MNDNNFFLCSVSGKELSVIAGLLAAASAEVLDIDELNVLGNFITAIGACMLTIAAADQSCAAINSASGSNNKSGTADENAADGIIG
ncbi:MAG: hypothetical protein BGN88_08530 [Clostridiales bacterium 43-6]|nr:MAG: hypothetical protein BGN88_08530 [Clostridiales bacterium 43-6]